MPFSKLTSSFQAEVTFPGIDGELKSQTSFRFDFHDAISPWLRWVMPLPAFVILARRRWLNLFLAYVAGLAACAIGNRLIPADEHLPLSSIMQMAVIPSACLLVALPWILQRERRAALGRAVLLMGIAGLVCATILTRSEEWAYVPQYMLIAVVNTMVWAAGFIYGGCAKNERNPATGFLLRSIISVTALSAGLACVYPAFQNLVPLSWGWSIPVYSALPLVLLSGLAFLLAKNRQDLARAASGSLPDKNESDERLSEIYDDSEQVPEEAIR